MSVLHGEHTSQNSPHELCLFMTWCINKFLKIYLFSHCVCIYVLCLHTPCVLAPMDVKSQKRWSDLELWEAVELLNVRSGNWYCVPGRTAIALDNEAISLVTEKKLKKNTVCVCFVSASLSTLRSEDNFVELRLSFHLYRGSRMERKQSSLCGRLFRCWAILPTPNFY